MAADAITLEELRGLCQEHEQLLRAQQKDGTLAPAVEEELLVLEPTTAMRAVNRLAVLKAAFRNAWKGSRRSEGEAEEAQAAAAALLLREPVKVRLECGRVVGVTSRSLAAMIELAAHQGRMQLLDAMIADCARLYANVLAEARRTWTVGRRIRLRRRLRRVEAVHRRLYSEQLGHRERLYAHLLTPDGAAARPDEPAPEWWREITAADDARLLLAAYQAGPMRYHKLGEAPEPKKKKRGDAEPWGYEGLLASWGIRRKVAPAAMLDTDLAQALTEMRLSAPPPLLEEEG